MVTMGLIDVLSIIIVIVIFGATLILPKKGRYLIAGIFLMGLGVIPILYDYSIIAFSISEYPVFNFAALFLVLFAGKDLIKEGFAEKQSVLKYPSIIIGIVIITLVSIPTLNSMGVIKFVLVYPPMVDHILYIISGLFLVIGIFTLLATKEDV